jgi:hypothetical protein
LAAEDAVVVLRWLMGTVLALALLGSATVAIASTGRTLYRTDQQAEHYLKYHLRSWKHHDLGSPESRAAFCITGYSAKPERNEQYKQGRMNRAGDHVYRTFACTLNAVVDGHARVFGLYLVSTRNGWRVTALR